MIILAIFLVLALGLFAFISGLDQRTQQGRTIRERLATLDSQVAQEGGSSPELLRDELLSSVPALDSLLQRATIMRRLQRFLAQADVKMRPGKVLLICSCVGAAAAAAADATGSSALAFLALALGWSAPLVVIAIMRRRRFNKFEELLPQAIDLLARAVRSGHAFSASLELIANELSEPIAGEFRKIYEEQKFGLAMREALMNLAARVPTFDVRFFTVAVIMQRDTGGNLAEVLDKLSYLIRERFKIQRQVRVYTAQGRLSMIILMALPFALAVIMQFMAPQYMQRLLTDPLGHALIGTGIVMLLIGYFLLQKIIRIRV